MGSFLGRELGAYIPSIHPIASRALGHKLQHPIPRGDSPQNSSTWESRNFSFPFKARPLGPRQDTSAQRSELGKRVSSKSHHHHPNQELVPGPSWGSVPIIAPPLGPNRCLWPRSKKGVKPGADGCAHARRPSMWTLFLASSLVLSPSGARAQRLSVDKEEVLHQSASLATAPPVCREEVLHLLASLATALLTCASRL